MELIRSHDALFRFVFGDAETMADLLRAELPEAVVAAIDWSSLRRREGSFVDESLRTSQADLLFEAVTRGQDGDEAKALLYVLCEHKSFDDRLLPLQIARYVVRVLDGVAVAHPGTIQLPVVLPFVVYHGEQPWRSHTDLGRLVDWGPWPPVTRRYLRRRQLRAPFHVLDLSTASESEITAMGLLPAADLALRFLRFLRRSDPTQALGDLRRWQQTLTRLGQNHRGRDVLFALFSWFLAGSPANHEVLRAVITNLHEEHEAMRTNLDLLLELNEERGLQQGMQQGVLVGERRLLRRQLRARFGDLPAAVDERIAGATAELLEAWAERVLTARSLDEVMRSNTP